MHFYSSLQQSEATGSYATERAVQLRDNFLGRAAKPFFGEGQETSTLSRWVWQTSEAHSSDTGSCDTSLLLSSQSCSCPTGYTELFACVLPETGPAEKGVAQDTLQDTCPSKPGLKQGLGRGGRPSLSDDGVKMRRRAEAGIKGHFFEQWWVITLITPNSDSPSQVTKAVRLKQCYPFTKSFHIPYAERGIPETRVTQGTLRTLD